MLWSELRGEGEPLLLYLHGLNATAAVWEKLDGFAAESWPGRRMLVDLPGHGRSESLERYAYGGLAASIAAEIGEAESVAIIGHSMGGVVALALASGWFGIPVSTVLAFGVKVSWTDEELAKGLAVSRRPPKEFDARLEAAERFLLLAGLGGLAAPDDPIVETGISELPGGRVRVAADPRASGIGAPAMDSLMAAAQAPVRMACGSEDALVSVDELRRLDPDAEEWAGVSHNAQVEAPRDVWTTFERCSPVPLQPWVR